MSRVEDIQKAERDVELLQSGLDKVSVALREAEKVAVLGAEVRRRAPVVALAVVGVAVLAAGAVLLLRRRRHRPSAADGSGPGEGPAAE